MSAIFFALSLCAAPPAAQGISPPPNPHALRQEIRDALRAEATAESRDERVAAVLKLLELAPQVATVKPMSEKDRLALQTKIRYRLLQLDKSLARDATANGGGADGDPGDALIELIESTIAPKTWKRVGGSGVIKPFRRGQPVAGFGGAGAQGGGALADQHEALIELIQNTIAPDTWDVNGGPGVIRYWPH